MFIVDSQVHIWGPNTPERPWRTGPRNAPHRAEPFTKDDLLREMNAAGVARAVLVPPSMEGDRNDLVLDAARQHPDRFAVMGRIPLDHPERASELPRWRRQPGMMGIRVTFSSGGESLADGAQADWLWPAAERAGVPLMLAAHPEALADVGRIAVRHPALKMAIDHVAVVRGQRDDAAFAQLPLLLDLARHPNISVKLSALPCASTEAYPYPKLHKFVRRVYGSYGPQRLFWGTDLTRLPCSYRQAITLFTEEMPWLAASDIEWIMGKAICRWIGWGLPPETQATPG